MESPKRQYYEVDETREWAISESGMICWIRYFRSKGSGHRWAGSKALVMIGKGDAL